jgi:hypothetical protein
MSICREAVVGAERRVESFVVRERCVDFRDGMLDFRVLIWVSISEMAVGERLSAGSCERSEFRVMRLTGRVERVKKRKTNLHSPENPLSTTILLRSLAHDLSSLLHLLE